MPVEVEHSDEAIQWVIRLRDASAQDWEEFTSWLEASPGRRQAYDEVALADEELDALPRSSRGPVYVPEEVVGNAEERAGSWKTGRRAFLGVAAAAAIAGIVGYSSMPPPESFYSVETKVGERRAVQLAGGSRIQLNGSTKILLDRENPRFARLVAGEALFTVVHDASRPFQVEAGDARILDMGTVFNVVHSRGLVDVAVAEGEVIFNPKRESVSLSPGMSLHRENGKVSLVRVEIGAVGAWREGRLSYSSASISRIAADLARNSGVPVQTSSEIGATRFSGVIMLDKDPDRLVQTASAVLGVDAQRSEKGWLLTAAPR